MNIIIEKQKHPMPDAAVSRGNIAYVIAAMRKMDVGDSFDLTQDMVTNIPSAKQMISKAKATIKETLKDSEYTCRVVNITVGKKTTEALRVWRAA